MLSQVYRKKDVDSVAQLGVYNMALLSHMYKAFEDRADEMVANFQINWPEAPKVKAQALEISKERQAEVDAIKAQYEYGVQKFGLMETRRPKRPAR